MLCPSHTSAGTEAVSLSLIEKIIQNLESSLETLGILGMGAVWQQSLLSPVQTIALTRTTPQEVPTHSPSGEPSGHIQFSLDPSLWQQLTPQLYRQYVARVSPPTATVVGPVELKLPLPHSITALFCSSLGDEQDEPSVDNDSAASPTCQTSILGFPLMTPETVTADAVQWIILWHTDKLLSWQRSFLHQQAKLFQQYLRRNTDRLDQEGQIQALQASLHHINHQLKTPLELIQIHKDLIFQYYTAQYDQHGESNSLILSSLGHIQVTLDSMRHSLNRLTAKNQAYEPYSLQDLSNLFNNTFELLSPLATEKHISIHHKNISCKIWVDVWKISQAFQNLLHNAISFSPHGGEISCTWQSFKNEVLIQISDQGPGLMEKEEEIFVPFYSSRPGGTGLGLAITKQIILEHRGRIWAETLNDGGAQFSVVLPLSPPDYSNVKSPP